MIRRRYTHGLARQAVPDEDVNPNSYINNIADCMLVLMLGFLVALVARYGLDLHVPAETEDDAKMTGIEVSLDQDGDGVIDDNYVRRGEAYYDESTGNYYFVEE